MTETLVVGAGVAGLVLARELVLQGRTVRVLEASNRAGGQVERHEVGGIPLDAGAEAFATRGGIVRTYLERLGLADRIISPLDAPAWLHARDGLTVPLPRVSLMGIPSVPLAADVVRVVGRRAAWRGMLDLMLPAARGAKAATLGELVRTRMGDGILERLVAPVVEGIHSKHPDDLPVSTVPGLAEGLRRQHSLAHAVTRMRVDAPAGSLIAGLDGGMATLVEALLAELERYGVPVEYGVRVAEAHADHVVLASSTSAAGAGRAGSAALANSAAPAEPEVRWGDVMIAAPGLIDSADGHPAVTTTTHLITLVVDSPELLGAPRGTGVLVARGTTVRARAVTHLSAKWAWVREAGQGREVLRLSYESAPDVEEALRDASVLLGVPLPRQRLVDSAASTWQRASRITPPDGITLVGEQVAGTGLAAVIDHARRTAVHEDEQGARRTAEQLGQRARKKETS